MKTYPHKMSETTPPEHPCPGLYRHYKGGLYTLICVGRHSETEEWLVTYRSEEHGTYWVRPLKMWNESINGTPRFALMHSLSAKNLFSDRPYQPAGKPEKS
ncbi:DUF1653 domain-containing protein [Acetobacter thailandicus]|uniref:DUF1653 domain-containing protein n=1 Tax=Acetobacter thailandicus TaxID=1502842 RepID=UPI001FD55773|nr:DUF1653 domain-containing protein [Acetobacter thailandicus]